MKVVEAEVKVILVHQMLMRSRAHQERMGLM